jgi:hypothetical protein
MHWVLMVATAVSSSACFDNPSDEYAQLITGSWRMARVVAGKPAEGVLHLAWHESMRPPKADGRWFATS